jgi:hypothetical protein
MHLFSLVPASLAVVFDVVIRTGRNTFGFYLVAAISWISRAA